MRAARPAVAGRGAVAAVDALRGGVLGEARVDRGHVRLVVARPGAVGVCVVTRVVDVAVVRLEHRAPAGGSDERGREKARDARPSAACVPFGLVARTERRTTLGATTAHDLAPRSTVRAAAAACATRARVCANRAGGCSAHRVCVGLARPSWGSSRSMDTSRFGLRDDVARTYGRATWWRRRGSRLEWPTAGGSRT